MREDDRLSLLRQEVVRYLVFAERLELDEAERRWRLYEECGPLLARARKEEKLAAEVIADVEAGVATVEDLREARAKVARAARLYFFILAKCSEFGVRLRWAEELAAGATRALRDIDEAIRRAELEGAP